MTKPSKIANASKAGRYLVAGRTSDGVSVLRSAAKAKHFTSKQISETIEAVRAGAKKR